MTEPARTPSLDGLMNLPNRPPQAVSKSLFAEIAGVTKGRVSQMIAEGLPVRLDGKIDREEGLAWIEKNISRRSAPEAIAPSSCRSYEGCSPEGVLRSWGCEADQPLAEPLG